MITRLKRLKNKDQRKLIGVILLGKMTAVVILLGLMKGAGWYFARHSGRRPGRRYMSPTISSARSTPSGCWPPPSWCSSCRPASWGSVGAAACVVMFALRQIRGSWNLRVSKDGELEALDIHEHGRQGGKTEAFRGNEYKVEFVPKVKLEVGPLRSIE